MWMWNLQAQFCVISLSGSGKPLCRAKRHAHLLLDQKTLEGSPVSPRVPKAVFVDGLTERVSRRCQSQGPLLLRQFDTRYTPGFLSVSQAFSCPLSQEGTLALESSNVCAAGTDGQVASPLLHPGFSSQRVQRRIGASQTSSLPGPVPHTFL